MFWTKRIVIGDGEPVSLAEVKVPLFAVACETDHIAHWKGSFNGVRQMGSKDKTFIVSESGHIAGIVNPPSKGKYGHYVNDGPMTTPQEWILEYNLPFGLFQAYLGELRPTAGMRWRGNFFKCGDDTSHPHWASWSPIGEALNFHQPDTFGALEFAPD